MTLLAISFHSVNMHITRALWQEKAEKRQEKDIMAAKQEHAVLEDLPIPTRGCEPYSGGTFVVFDWEKNEVVWQVAVDGATGFCFRDDLLYINMMRLNETIALDGYGCERRRFSLPSFNNLHTIVPTSRGFLLTSTGTDSIIELNTDGELVYEWCALDHGFDTMKNQQLRIYARSLDQRYMMYSTDWHTTHVNSARFADSSEESILATLFVQGMIIAIDRQSGQARTLVRDLKRPHELRPYPEGGWVVSDTANNQVLLLDEQWQITQRIALGFDWVQCSTPFADGSIIVADTNNHRMVRFHPAHPQAYEVRTFPMNWRIYLIEEVSSLYTQFFKYPVASCPL